MEIVPGASKLRTKLSRTISKKNTGVKLVMELWSSFVSYEVSAASLPKGTRAWLKLHAGNQERVFRKA